MNKCRQKIKNEKSKKWVEMGSKLFICIVDFAMVLFAIISAFWNDQIKVAPLWQVIALAALGIVAVGFHVCLIIKQITEYPEYESIKVAEDLSKATLCAFKETNAAKRRYILQSTYGRVPKWHPIDYTQNILVYDVHEQIRSLLSSLQKLIVDTTEGMTEDQVTVDLVYCYPKQKNDEGTVQTSTQSQTRDNEWRIITSGNHSLGGSIHSYLNNKASFYHHVDDCGYCFCNDKMEIIESGHYIISDKDKEQKSKGSIVGLKMELRNDEPEAVFVQAILTITTYGTKLYKKGLIKQKAFEEIFKENVINSYRSFLLSELSQMYIRHAILEGDMCPRTGQLFSDVKRKKQRREAAGAKTCPSTGKKCRFCQSQNCSCNLSK